MKRNTATALLWINLICTVGIILFLAAAFVSGKCPFHTEEQGTSYTLYIGLNDKDTNVQEISTEDACAAVDAICVKYVEGFNAVVSWGAWTDENGSIVNEQALTYTFHNTDREKVTAIMDEVLNVLNQSSILMVSDTADPVFYSGK